MQLSSDAATLYLLAITYATSGNLAVIRLPSRSMTFVPGVIGVAIITSGPHKDELIYQRRVWSDAPDGNSYPSYPFIHATVDGRQIREISNEFSVGRAPILRKYLTDIRAMIEWEGQKLP
jgi:hypothetical protein